MLITIFKSVLLMSAVGAALAVVLLCLKPITRKLFSPKWQYYIWLTVLLVMILPVRFTLPQRTPDIVPVQSAQNVAVDVETAIIEAQSNVTEQPPEPRTVPKINLPRNIMWYLSIIWLSGMILILLVKTAKYGLFSRTIRKNSYADNTILSIPKRLRVRRTQMLDAPLIIGLIKPVLYLPDVELTQNDMNYILMHELTHYKRHDLLYKRFAMLVLSVHWFNPLIYAVSKQIDLECEISCDAAVASKLTETEQNNYMNMILDMLINSKSKPRPLTTQMASSKKILKRRFTMIRNKKKTSKFVSVLSAVIALVMLGTTVFASGVLSDLNKGHMIINGREYPITPIFIENSLACHTDSYYVPLRETFEALGYEVHYNADKEKYSIDNVQFPFFDRGDYEEFYDEEADEWVKLSNKEYNNWLKSMVTNTTDYYIYGQTVRLNAQMPIIEMTKDGTTEYCQIGCQTTSMGYLFGAPTLIDGKAYIPIRAIAYLVGGDDNVKWNDEAHDTYYEGALTFDEENLTIKIDTTDNETDINGFYHQVIGEYSVKIPDSWSGKYTVKTSENGDMLTFFQRASYDKYGVGVLFRIEKVNTEDANELLGMLGGSKLLYSDDNYAYIFEIPTDVQYPIWTDNDEEDISIVKEYKEMFKDIDIIADSFEITNK